MGGRRRKVGENTQRISVQNQAPSYINQESTVKAGRTRKIGKNQNGEKWNKHQSFSVNKDLMA